MIKRNLEFRYQGGGVWMANIMPHDNVPYVVYTISKEGVIEDGTGIHVEYEVYATLLHKNEYDPRNGRYKWGAVDTLVAGSYDDAVMLANDLREKIESEYAVQPTQKPTRKRGKK